MPFALDPQYLDVRDEARRVAEQIKPMAVEADAMSTPHDGVRKALAESRLGEFVVPGAHGGRGDRVDPVAVCVTREQLMMASCHADSVFALQGIGSYALSVAGSDQVQRTWLPRVARLDAIAALALTEDEAGSDAKAVSTTVRVDGDALVVDGHKTWISNGGFADFYTVLAREGEGWSTVLVPADAPGVSAEPLPAIIAPHVLGEIQFNDVRVPVDHRIGEPEKGFAQILATLAVFRVSVAGAAVGIAQAALDEMTRHARHRQQFGRPLAKIGPVAQMLARAWADVESARMLTYRAAEISRDDPRASLPHASMAKVEATEAASRVVDIGVQIMGRWGLQRDSLMERLYRASRPMRVYEGATEVLRLGISQALCDRQAEEDSP